MIKVENKYELGQQVFYYEKGSIWHCRITSINVNVRPNDIKINYDIMSYDNTLFSIRCKVDENLLVSDIQDIINIIPIK